MEEIKVGIRVEVKADFSFVEDPVDPNTGTVLETWEDQLQDSQWGAPLIDGEVIVWMDPQPAAGGKRILLSAMAHELKSVG